MERQVEAAPAGAGFQLGVLRLVVRQAHWGYTRRQGSVQRGAAPMTEGRICCAQASARWLATGVRE